jgi:transmembrane sensor
MLMFDTPTARRIARYIAGECSADEAREVREWIAADPARAEYVAALERVWAATGNLPVRWDSVAAWSAVRARLAPTRPEAVPEHVAPPPPVARPRWHAWTGARRSSVSRIAAVLATVAVGALWWIAARQEPPAPAPAPMREIATQRGQLADVYLSDGTHVLLGVASRLRFAAPLSATSRDVYLDGEAVFEVTPDTQAPFIVHTSHATARDVGTRFDVRAYPGDTTTTVVVAEGRVLLAPRADSAGALLNAGDLGQVGAAAAVRTQRGVAVDRYFAWTDRQLVFTDVPLRDVLPQLGRWYDLEFRLGDSSLATRRLTATLTSESVPELLRGLSLTVEIRAERHGRVVTLFPKSRRS